MKTKIKFKSILLNTLILVISLLLITPDFLEARGGFGGSRSMGGSRSFGGSRSRSVSPSRSSPPATSPRSSFGGSKSASPGAVKPGVNSAQRSSSFGGTHLNSGRDYTTKYGVPRRVIPGSQMSGVPGNYRVHDYGGWGSGFMMGYVAGHSSWMWGMPFHPYYYYSTPYRVYNPDGTVDWYPPTFSWGKLFFTLLIIFAVIFIIAAIVRSVRRNRLGGSSQSSFG